MYGIYTNMNGVFVDGKCGSIYGIHTDPMGFGMLCVFYLWLCSDNELEDHHFLVGKSTLRPCFHRLLHHGGRSFMMRFT